MNYRDYEAPLAARIGKRIRTARLAAGITQGELARRMGTQQPSIARAELGMALPSLRFLQEVADALGTFMIEPIFALSAATPFPPLRVSPSRAHANGHARDSLVAPALVENVSISS